MAEKRPKNRKTPKQPTARKPYRGSTPMTVTNKAAEDMAQQYLDIAGVMILATDADVKVTLINKKGCDILGYTEEEIIGKNWFDTFIPKDRVAELEDIEQKLKAGEITSVEYHENPVLTRSGEERLIAWHNTVMTDEAGKFAGCLSSGTDITERCRAEEELRLQRDFAQGVFDTAQAIMLVLDKEGRINNFNPYLEEMSGYKLEEVRGRYWFDTFVPGQYRNKIKHLFDKAIDDVRTRGSTAPIVTKDGRLREVEWYDKTLKDLSDNVIGLLAVGHDVTERKRAEERHQTILSTALDGFWMIDLKGKMLEVNDSYCKMVGYTREEFLKMSVADIEALDSAKDILQHIKKIVAQGSDRFETRHRNKQGWIVDVDVSANYLDVGDGQIFVFVRDITRRKQAKERIEHLNRTLRSILAINQLITREKDRDALIKGVCENLVDCGCCCTAWVALLDESHKLVAHSVAGFSGDFSPMVEILKQGKLPPCVRKTMGQTTVVITEDPSTACVGCPLRPEKTTVGGMSVRLAHGDKTSGILCASVLPETLADKDEISLFKEVADDIAYALYNMELAAQNELLEQERLRRAKLESISTLAGGIAHDFNNLLTGIMGNIGLAKMNVKTDDKIFETLDEAEVAAGRARELTQQLLTFARGGKPVKKTVDIAGLIKESATFALRGSAVRLELSLPDDLYPVEVDEGQINQVIQNIVINADESMPNGGVVRIDAENMRVKKGSLPLPADNYLRINIADEGVGISKENLQRMFEPYFTTKQKGSGLGLSTVYSIVRNHGGYVTAESVSGRGTVFHIYLPASAKPSPAKDKPEASQTGRKGGRILVMDDEAVIRKMLINMLKVVGYEVEVTSEGAEAIEAYRRAMESGQPFDAVIMDLTIPGGIGGKEAVGKMLEIDPDARVIVSSGYTTDAVMSDYKKYGFSAVIAKPYSINQLEEALNSLPRRGS